ncbi:Golgi transport complex subunit 5-domain-containing protein [Mycena floridula]|nr:Golgi transport complex subunit 5-domain-containing protein [Mycena floridula]
MNDYAIFASPNFDPNDYANAVLAGEQYPQPTESKSLSKRTAAPEASAAISKLSFGIDDVAKQLKNVVSAHHEDFLSQAASANDLSGSLTSVRAGLTDLDTSLEKLRLKIRVPYQSLQANVSRLQKLQQASDVLRRTSRFVVLARRLETQMSEMESSVPETAGNLPVASTGDREDEKERTIAKAALSIAELVSLLEGPNESKDVSPERSDVSAQLESDTGTTIPLRSITAVAAHVSFIEDARSKVTSEMESMVLNGLMTLNQSLLASSLQTAYNLRVLPDLVQSLVLDLSQAVEDRIRNAFDLSKISKFTLPKDSATNTPPSPTSYKSRVRTEPTTVTAPQWTTALWSRMESMVEEMADCCIKVYTLEKVLKMKRDTVSQVVFLDEAMKLLENKPSATFWSALGRSLEKHTRDSVRSSTFLQQTLSTGYPRLLRLFHEFFAKIAVHTDTVYVHSQQSPETVLILRAISNFESLYLSRSSTRLNEAVSQAFAGGSRAPPGASDGINIARTITNELDSARFDPLLVISVTKNAISSLDVMLSRTDNLIVRDRSSVNFVGPTATPQQTLNGSVATFMYQCWLRLSKLEDEYSDSAFKILKPSIDKIHAAYERVIDPVLTSIRRELGAIIARLHRIDFGKTIDPMTGGGSSFYMKDLVEKMSFIKAEILSKYNVGDDARAWMLSVVKYVIRTFVLHISIAKPLGESGKLQLTSDMTELEFALNAFMIQNQSQRGGNLESVGDDYRTLRAMRPLLFLENGQLASPSHTAGLPPLIVLHHILVRSPVPLPHTLHGWQEAEYVRWVDEHSEEEALSLVELGLSRSEQVNAAEGVDPKASTEYVQLARTVLANNVQSRS